MILAALLLPVAVVALVLLVQRFGVPVFLALMAVVAGYGIAADMTFQSIGKAFGLGFVTALEQAGLLVMAGALVGMLAIGQPLRAPMAGAVLDALGRLGLSKDQLSTEGYSAYPEMNYDRPGNTPRVTGYVVTNSVRAESKRVDQAGSIIDAALGAGANIINALSFYASSIEEARRQAIGAAVASARADAEAMAQAAGGRLGALLELSTQGPTIPPRPMFDLAARGKVAMAEQTPINPGQQTVTVFVTARWTFIPRE